jgi:hypothetical protein
VRPEFYTPLTPEEVPQEGPDSIFDYSFGKELSNKRKRNEEEEEENQDKPPITNGGTTPSPA